MTHPYLRGPATPRVFAHRGLLVIHGDDPPPLENSVVAFAAAHAAGAEYVETDCRLTADGIVVLFHDETLERLFADPRPLREVTSVELEALFADRGGLLTLQGALETFPSLRFNVDVKERAAAAGAGATAAVHSSRVLLTSFSDATRRAAVHAAAISGTLPAVSAGSSTIAALRLASVIGSRSLARRVLRGIDAVQVPERFGRLRILTPAFVRLAHLCGAEVHVWTVNDPRRMAALIDMGVDGVVTDRANLALDVLRPERRGSGDRL